MKLNLNSQSWLIIYSYFIANGLLYSYVFWREFEINILQYVSPYDLLPSILFIIIIPLVLFGFYCFITAIIIPANERADTFFEKKKSRVFHIAKLIVGYLIRIFIVVTTIIFLFSSSTFLRDFAVVEVISIIAVTQIQKRTTLFSDKGKFRDIYIAALIGMPLSIYVYAHLKADAIKKGNDSYIVTSDSDCTKTKNDTFRYISSIGDKAFAYSLNDDSLCVFKYNYLHLNKESRMKLGGAKSLSESYPDAI